MAIVPRDDGVRVQQGVLQAVMLIITSGDFNLASYNLRELLFQLKTHQIWTSSGNSHILPNPNHSAQLKAVWNSLHWVWREADYLQESLIILKLHIQHIQIEEKQLCSNSGLWIFCTVRANYSFSCFWKKHTYRENFILKKCPSSVQSGESTIMHWISIKESAVNNNNNVFSCMFIKFVTILLL